MNQPFDVLYEDNHLIVVSKRAGWLVQGDKTGDVTLGDAVKDYIKAKYQKPGDVFLGVVHRLDRPVSGLVVLARTSKALERMNALFRDRKTLKVYLAVVCGHPKDASGTLVHWLRKDSIKNKTTAFTRETPDALRSSLAYKVLATVGNKTLVEVRPETGRPHQIRVQLASLGTPICGDVKYGAPEGFPEQSIALHAYRLEFIHPVKKELLTITAPLAEFGIWEIFTTLGYGKVD